MTRYSENHNEDLSFASTPEEILPPILAKHGKPIGCVLQIGLAAAIIMVMVGSEFCGWIAGLAIAQPPSGSEYALYPLFWFHSRALNIALFMLVGFLACFIILRKNAIWRKHATGTRKLIYVAIAFFIFGLGTSHHEGGYLDLDSIRQDGHVYRVNVWQGQLAYGQPRVLVWECGALGISCDGMVVALEEDVDPSNLYLHILKNGEVVLMGN